MRITDLLDKRSVMLYAAPSDKKQTLEQAISLMVQSGKIADEEAYRQQVFAREEESTTGIGEGIAIPHGKCDAVTRPGLAAMVIPGGVDFDSLDGEPVTLLFLIAAPNTKDNVHLDVLSKLSMMLMDEEFTAKLRSAKSVDEFMQIVDAADSERVSIDEQLQTKDGAASKILAVTSCPTGIAHTYMAAEGLEKAAAHRLSCAVDKQCLLRFLRYQSLSAMLQIRFQRCFRFISKQNRSGGCEGPDGTLRWKACDRMSGFGRYQQGGGTDRSGAEAGCTDL